MKRPTYRCEDNKYKELLKKLIDDDMSFQDFADWCVDQYLEGNYNPKEEMKMKRNEMINVLAGNYIDVDFEWLKENDEELLDWITTSEYWGRGFDRKIEKTEVVARIIFHEGGNRVYATFKSHPEQVKQSLNNQPPWGEDSWEDWETEDIAKYYNEFINQS